MDPFIQNGPLIPIFKSVRGSLYSGRFMDRYMQIGPWIPICRSVRGSLSSGRSTDPYINVWIWLIISFGVDMTHSTFTIPPPPITINMSHMIWLFIISPMEMAILHVKLVWLLDALWRPLFLVIKSSWSLLGTSSKYDSGRLEQYMKNLRNFHKIYAFRPEVYLELFQVQIRTALYRTVLRTFVIQWLTKIKR